MKPRAPVLGQHYGRLTITAEAGYDHTGARRMVACRCSCGETTKVKLEHLRDGSTRSCGCLRRETSAIPRRRRPRLVPAATPLPFGVIGRRYARLRIVQDVGRGNRRQRYARHVKCECDCGGTVVAQLRNVRRGITTSCGCARSEAVAASNRARWAAMRMGRAA